MEATAAPVDQLVKGLNDTGITRATPAPFNAKDFMKRSLYGYGNASGGVTTTSIENVHSIFAAGLERRRRAAMADLGYGNDACTANNDTQGEQPNKRRRFQRRNSKTSAMLFKTLNSLPTDFFAEESKKEEAPKPTPVVKTDDEDDWDGGLEIAEQLVKHLQKRRASDASVTAH